MEEPSLEDYSCMLGRPTSCQSSSYSQGNTSRHLCPRLTRNRSKLSAVVWTLHLFVVDSKSVLQYLYIYVKVDLKRNANYCNFIWIFLFFNREKPAMPSNVLSLIQLRTMPLHDQVKTLLTNGEEKYSSDTFLNFFIILSKICCSPSQKYLFSG